MSQSNNQIALATQYATGASDTHIQESIAHSRWNAHAAPKIIGPMNAHTQRSNLDVVNAKITGITRQAAPAQRTESGKPNSHTSPGTYGGPPEGAQTNKEHKGGREEMLNLHLKMNPHDLEVAKWPNQEAPKLSRGPTSSKPAATTDLNPTVKRKDRSPMEATRTMAPPADIVEMTKPKMFALKPNRESKSTQATSTSHSAKRRK